MRSSADLNLLSVSLLNPSASSDWSNWSDRSNWLNRLGSNVDDSLLGVNNLRLELQDDLLENNDLLDNLWLLINWESWELDLQFGNLLGDLSDLSLVDGDLLGDQLDKFNDGWSWFDWNSDWSWSVNLSDDTSDVDDFLGDLGNLDLDLLDLLNDDRLSINWSADQFTSENNDSLLENSQFLDLNYNCLSEDSGDLSWNWSDWTWSDWTWS